MRTFRLHPLVSSPIRLGTTISLLFLVVLGVLETVLGRWPAVAAAAAEGNALSRQSEGTLRDLRIAGVHCLLAGYLPAAFLAVLEGGRRTVRELQGALDCTAQECERLARSIRLGRGGLAVALAVGILIAIGGPYVTPPVPRDVWNPLTWSPEVVWHRVLGPWVAIWGSLLAYAVIVVSRRMSGLATELSSIDLFELDTLAPFTRQGLRNALLVLGFLGILGIMVLTETGFGVLGASIGTAVVVTGSLSLFLPLRGVHRRIESAKRGELAWIDGRLRESGMELRLGTSRPATGEMADLAAYRDLVRAVHEWPIGRSGYVRFGLYLLIPLGSWALAALVEHVVDAFVFPG